MLICFHIVKSSFLVCILVQHHIVPMHFHPSASRVLSRILPGVASEVLQWSIHDMTGVLTRVLTGGDSPSHYPSHIPSHHLLIAMTPIIPKHNTFVHFFLPTLQKSRVPCFVLLLEKNSLFSYQKKCWMELLVDIRDQMSVQMAGVR